VLYSRMYHAPNSPVHLTTIPAIAKLKVRGGAAR
jgi:hypothetical protein